MKYRRYHKNNAIYFLTVNLQNRKSTLLTDEIDLLRRSFSTVKKNHPFDIVAIVVLPDHFHIMLTLPEGDSDYPKRIRLIKSYFSKAIPKNEPIPLSRRKKSERGIWQRRYWEHTIKDERDFINHIKYIQSNSIKHKLVTNIHDWPYSSFFRK